MRAAGLLHHDVVPDTLALSIFAALPGSLLLTRTMQSIEPRSSSGGSVTALHAWHAQAPTGE
jgi:hypothetical protein